MSGGFDWTGLGSLAIGVANGLTNYFINKDNLKYQKENLDYQKALQQTIFDREDTAIERRMRDLENSGLNPQLAAGSGAGSGAIVSTEAPQNKTNPIGSAIDSALAYQQLAQQKEITKQAQARTDYIEDTYAQQLAAQYLINLNRLNTVNKGTLELQSLFGGDKFNYYEPRFGFGKGVNNKPKFWYNGPEYKEGSFADTYFTSLFNQKINQGSLLNKKLLYQDLVNNNLGLQNDLGQKKLDYFDADKWTNYIYGGINAIGSFF